MAWHADLRPGALVRLFDGRRPDQPGAGPDLAFILGHTARDGRRGGTAAMLGTWAGGSCHVVLAAAGLSAIVAASATAFAAVKWAGVAYPVWLGVQALRSKGGLLTGAVAPAAGGFWQVFRQGVLADLLNPKVAIFFLAFLPQFVAPGAGPVWLQLLVHGALIFAVAAVLQPPLVLLGDRLDPSPAGKQAVRALVGPHARRHADRAWAEAGGHREVAGPARSQPACAGADERKPAASSPRPRSRARDHVA